MSLEMRTLATLHKQPRPRKGQFESPAQAEDRAEAARVKENFDTLTKHAVEMDGTVEDLNPEKGLVLVRGDESLGSNCDMAVRYRPEDGKVLQFTYHDRQSRYRIEGEVSRGRWHIGRERLDVIERAFEALPDGSASFMQDFALRLFKSGRTEFGSTGWM